MTDLLTKIGDISQQQTTNSNLSAEHHKTKCQKCSINYFNSLSIKSKSKLQKFIKFTGLNLYLSDMFANTTNPNPISETKKMTDNRILMLSEKINNLKFGQKAESEKKLELVERTCEDLESEIDNIKANFDHHCFDLKNTMGKLERELNHDYAGTARMVKEEIRRCEEKFIEMTENHIDDRKKSDVRLAKFMEEKCSILRDLIERQAKQRIIKGQEIQESLTSDLIEIKGKLEDEKAASSENLEQIHTEFLGEYEQMRNDFEELCDKSSENQGEFYKLLRDILKKVKEELSHDKVKRQEMQETILALIEKICDKAMEEVCI